MRQERFIGYFNNFTLTVYTNGFNNAYYLLKAKAISEAKDPSTLFKVENEYNQYYEVNPEPNIFNGRKK